MRVFIYEDLCGGGFPAITESLAREGRAMLSAVISDFLSLCEPATPFVQSSRIEHCPPPWPSLKTTWPWEVVSLWDARNGQLPFDEHSRLSVVLRPESEAEDQTFHKLVLKSDAVLVIAPETGGRLRQLCKIVQKANKLSLNATPSAIALCGDKLAFSERLAAVGIATIPTFSPHVVGTQLNSLEQLIGCDQFIIKPRDGAGSQGIQRLQRSELQDWLANSHNFVDEEQQWIVQPVVSGAAFSVMGQVQAESGRLICFPAARQRLSQDGRFAYLGGEIPAADVSPAQVERLLQKIVTALPGLHGLFGVDFLKTPAEELVVVEVNPRYTTSYVGYRMLAGTNLARLYCSESSVRALRWQGWVTYQPDGTVRSGAAQGASIPHQGESAGNKDR